MTSSRGVSPSTGAPAGDAPARRSLWRDGMLWLIVGIMVATVGLNLTMLWYAEDDPPELVRPDYYAASKTYDVDHAARLASARLGWQVVQAPRSRSLLAMRITDAEGRPVSGLVGHVSAYRASDVSLDQTLQWSEDPAQPGLYRATFARPAAGLWRITLDVRHDGKRLYEDVSVVMP